MGVRQRGKRRDKDKKETDDIGKRKKRRAIKRGMCVRVTAADRDEG